MTRPYGTVGGRPPSRGGGGAAWQWIIIGGTFGFGCAAVVFLLFLTLGILEFGGAEPETVAVIPTNTVAPEVPNIQATIDAAVNAAISTNLPAVNPTDEVPSGILQLSEADVMATVDALMAERNAQEANTNNPPVNNQQDNSGTVSLPTATPRVVVTVQQEPDQEQPINTQTAPEVQATTSSSILSQPTPQPQQPEDPRLERLKMLSTTLIPIPGGVFEMGTTIDEIEIAFTECRERDQRNCQIIDSQDAFPPHQVQLDDFFIEETLVTYEQYLAFLDYLGPGQHRSGCGGYPCVLTTATGENEHAFIQFDSQNYDLGNPQFHANLPVGGVSWYGANAYCEAIGRRLPTEAEWERAARGPNNTVYPWGNSWDPNAANVSTQENRPTTPHAVKSRLSNVSGYGVYDMAGTLAQWVSDWYFSDYYPQQAALGVSINPTGPTSGQEKVLRGGSWNGPPFFSRSVQRLSFAPGTTLSGLHLWMGFRCAADQDASSTVNITVQSTETPATGNLDLDLTLPIGDAPTGTNPNEVDNRPTLPDLPGLVVPDTSSTEIPAVPPGG